MSTIGMHTAHALVHFGHINTNCCSTSQDLSHEALRALSLVHDCVSMVEEIKDKVVSRGVGGRKGWGRE
jgi:hypothetical protein